MKPIRISRNKKQPGVATWYKRLARFMPKSAARIFLEVTKVRAERIQDISQEDAKAEGVFPAPHRCEGWKNPSLQFQDCFRCAFKFLWQSLHGPESWNRNDWVFPYDFQRVEKPADR